MLNDIAEEIQKWAVSKGWDAKVGDNKSKFGELVCLMHSELSEALEEFRIGRGVNEVYYKGDRGMGIGKPEGIPIELADTIIRILHFCAANDIDIDNSVRLKMKYNMTREFKHGGKIA